MLGDRLVGFRVGLRDASHRGQVPGSGVAVDSSGRDPPHVLADRDADAGRPGRPRPSATSASSASRPRPRKTSELHSPPLSRPPPMPPAKPEPWSASKLKRSPPSDTVLGPAGVHFSVSADVVPGDDIAVRDVHTPLAAHADRWRDLPVYQCSPNLSLGLLVARFSPLSKPPLREQGFTFRVERTERVVSTRVNPTGIVIAFPDMAEGAVTDRDVFASEREVITVLVARRSAYTPCHSAEFVTD